MFPAKLGRFVRFRALRELHDRYLTFVGELNVWRAGTGANQAPVDGDAFTLPEHQRSCRKRVEPGRNRQ